MNLYNCFVKKDQAGKIEDILLICDNFSWSSLIFNSLFFAWFIFHRMWREVLTLLITLLLIEYLSNSVPILGSFFFQLALYFLIALNSKTWLGEHLTKKCGYQLAGMVFGHNSLDAKLKAVLEIENNSSFQSPFAKPSAFSNKLFAFDKSSFAAFNTKNQKT